MVDVEEVADVEAIRDDAWLLHEAFWHTLFCNDCYGHNSASTFWGASRIFSLLHVPGDVYGDGVALVADAVKKRRY